MNYWNAEHGHYRVADKLLDRPAVPLHDGLGSLEVARHHMAEAFGSIRSPSAVEPMTSQKSTVTVFRTSRAEAAAASGSPQESQKRAPSRFSAPQLAQTITVRV